MNKKHIQHLKKINQLIQVLFLMQFVLLSMVIGYLFVNLYLYDATQDIKMIIYLVTIILFFIPFNIYAFFKDKSLYKNLNQEYQMQEESYEHIEQLNRTLRVQRHDFLNHIQVVYSLLEMKEYDEITKYLDKLYGDIGQLSSVLKTDKIAVNALLQAKAFEADRKDIKFEMDIRTGLSHLSMEEWELCKCLGNLIDNAFEATLKSNDQKVSITIGETIHFYSIMISNIGEKINEGALVRLFEAGFSTKGNGEERGMGLFIVKSIINKYKGEVKGLNNENGVTFTIKLPKVTIET
jgi:sensor histidine kinase regulating citrate/malate metabolism